jgi:hypothetical protein
VSRHTAGHHYYGNQRVFSGATSMRGSSTPNLKIYILPAGNSLEVRFCISNEIDLILESVREFLVDNVPLRVERHAYFRAGETYFVHTVEHPLRAIPDSLVYSGDQGSYDLPKQKPIPWP